MKDSDEGGCEGDDETGDEDCDEDDDEGSEEGWMIDSDRLGSFGDGQTNRHLWL